MDQLLHEGYRARAAGEADAAREAFDEAVELAQASGARLAPGLGDTLGQLVPARGGLAALEMDGGSGHPVLFFDAGSGEPLSFEDHLPPFAHEPALPEPPLFLLQAYPRQVFFDPKSGSRLIEGERVVVRPGGKLAYAFREDDCRWHVWDLHTRKELPSLVPPARPDKECDVAARRSAAFISASGRFLVDGHGWWNLDTRSFVRVAAAGSDGFALQGSPDRRYVAYVSTIPGASPDAMGAYHHIHLVDLSTGAKTRTAQPLHVLSNGAPLSFGQDPLRLCVFDYTRWAFAVPSLRLLARFPREDRGSDGDDEGAADRQRKEEALIQCDDKPSPPPTVPLAETDLGARLALRVCHIAGRLVPRALCEKAAPPTTVTGPQAAPRP